MQFVPKYLLWIILIKISLSIKSMCDKENSKEYPINNFEVALQMRNFEIEQLTQRNNFLMVFQGVLFAGLVQSGHTKPVVSFMVCVAGFVVSLFQIGMASGAKFWQNYWEQILHELEKEEYKKRNISEPGRLLFHGDNCLYSSKVENIMSSGRYCALIKWLILRRHSVSRIPIYVGISFSVIWFFLILSTLLEYPPFSIPSCIVGFTSN